MSAKAPRQGNIGIAAAMAALIEDLGIGEKIKDAEVLDLWKTVVGETIAAVTVPQKIEAGRLYIHVTKSTWRNELVFLKAEILKKINAAMKQEIVKEIIFR